MSVTKGIGDSLFDFPDANVEVDAFFEVAFPPVPDPEYPVGLAEHLVVVRGAVKTAPVVGASEVPIDSQ